MDLSPVFVFLLDEQPPEQLLQQLVVPLNRPRMWWTKYATAMRTTIATMIVAGLIDIPPFGIGDCYGGINLSGPLNHGGPPVGTAPTGHEPLTTSH